jgi:hypothetical protein
MAPARLIFLIDSDSDIAQSWQDPRWLVQLMLVSFMPNMPFHIRETCFYNPLNVMSVYGDLEANDISCACLLY